MDRLLKARVDGHRQPDLPTERVAQGPDEVLADVGLQHLLGVVVGNRDEGGLFDDCHQSGESDEGPFTGRDPGALQRQQGATPQVSEIDVRACHDWPPPSPTSGRSMRPSGARLYPSSTALSTGWGQAVGRGDLVTGPTRIVCCGERLHPVMGVSLAELRTSSRDNARFSAGEGSWFDPARRGALPW